VASMVSGVTLGPPGISTRWLYPARGHAFNRSVSTCRRELHRAGGERRIAGMPAHGVGGTVVRAVLAVAIALGLLAIALAPGAQPPGSARIGYLSLSSASADSAQREAFRQGLRDLGYVEGQNVVIEARFADGKTERLAALADELVRLKVDVIVAAPTPASRAAWHASRTIPIVMAFSGDPVGEGFVASLARPGGNVTGISTNAPEVATKRLELLKAVVPSLSHVIHLSGGTTTKQVITETEAAGRTLGVQVTTVLVRDARSVNDAFATVRNSRVGGLIVALTIQEHWAQVLDLARKNRLPTISGPREFAQLGGFMAYGPKYPDLYRRAATFVDKILKGARPADLPVEQATQFELAINRQTAKALGLTLPSSVALRADHVID
jgi:putative tryptophan/tyrosine transport system substrate-binding protein